MNVNVKETTMVKPAGTTPRRSLWLSDMDLLFPQLHSPCVYFYRPNGASNFFDSAVLKEALSKVLVPFYPLAGRFRHDDNGRLEIDCNGEGVLFIEAKCDSVVDDFGDFVPSPELQRLLPTVDCSSGYSSYPLLALQVTYLGCGGVSIGVSVEHRVADGSALMHFVNSWSRISRGLNVTNPPFLDRTILHPRDPPQVMFDHPEYGQVISAPAIKSTRSENVAHHDELSKISVLKITKEELNILKASAKREGDKINYSTFEILAGHIWKCTCMARALPKDQETRLFFSASGRYLSRLQPPLPPGYIGNVIFSTITVATAGDIQSKPFSYAASLIHQTLVRLDNNYLRSVIDYLKLRSNTKRYSPNDSRSPNLAITSWLGLPTREADFGWGQPFYTGPGRAITEGRAGIFPSAAEDGGLFINIALEPQHMKVFEKLFYEYGRANSSRKTLKANM